MKNLTRLSFIWIHVFLWTLSSAVDVTTGNTAWTSTTAQSDRTGSINVLLVKIEAISKTPHSIQVRWNRSKDHDERCNLIIRKDVTMKSESERASGESTHVIHIQDTRQKEIGGLSSNTLYEVLITCYGPNQHGFVTRTFVKTLELKTSSYDHDQGGESSAKRLVWLIPTIFGSLIFLIIIVAGSMASSRAISKKRTHGKVVGSRNESGKKLVTNTDADDEREVDLNKDRKFSALDKDLEAKHEQRRVTEMNTIDTIQIRQPTHLTRGFDDRAATSAISWGSEFDVLDQPDGVYSNETHVATSPPPFSTIHTPSEQVPSYRQNYNKIPGSPLAVTNFNLVVPVKSNREEQFGIYTNVQQQESIYANTGVHVEEGPPVIPRRPR